MDLSTTIAPRSDQLNAEDLLSGPVTVTIANVREGAAEQPVDIDLVEYPGRAYRPNLTMRRVLVLAWGRDSTAYIGRRMTLYRDPDVKFGRDTVGGIKISHLSHLPSTRKWPLTESRGKRKVYTVEPLPDVAPTTLREMPAEDEPATPEQADTLATLAAELGLTVEREAAAAKWASKGRTGDLYALTHDEAAAAIEAMRKQVKP